MPVYEWQREKPLRIQGDDVVEEGETFDAPEAVGDAFDELVEEQDGGAGSADVEVELDRENPLGGQRDEDEDDQGDSDEGA